MFVTPSDTVGAALVSQKPCKTALKTFGNTIGCSVQLGFATVTLPLQASLVVGLRRLKRYASLSVQDTRRLADMKLCAESGCY